VSGTASAIDIQLRGLEGAPWGVYPEFVESANREEYLKLHLDNVKAREKWWIGSEAVPYVGIVVSEQTRALFAQGALPLYLSHALGAFRAIFEKHWPVRVLTEYDLEDAKLSGVRVLMLPNVACLSDRAAEVVRRFVRQGGGLVASFETGLFDETFARRKDSALADLFHANYVKTHAVAQRSENLYLSLDAKHPIVDDPLIKAKQMTAWAGGLGPTPPNRETWP
jgi:beta-galactosidase GanA